MLRFLLLLSPHSHSWRISAITRIVLG
jgi:hypothetical protein